jgi:hypothetical protein
MLSCCKKQCNKTQLKSNNYEIMKKMIITAVSVAAFAVSLTQTARGVPISGVIGFSGSAQLDAPTVASSTEVLAWYGNVTGIASGSFAGLTGSTVALAAPWLFNSGAENAFWSVGGFTFNLASSSVLSRSATSVTVGLVGTVVSTIAGFSPTAFTGSFTTQDPSLNNGGVSSYTESLSFSGVGVPDGGSTILLMGIAGLALGLMKFDWRHSWS